MLFTNRHDAALSLIPLLAKYQDEDGVVLAVPRGGVPIGYEIARAYHFPMELLLTKKIGHPDSPELAVGAVSPEGYMVDKRYFDISPAYIKHEISRIREFLKNQYKKYVGDRKPLDLQGKVVIIVDDGIATGNTLLASIQLIRQKQPKKIVVAVPVAPVQALDRVGSEVDDFITVRALKNFVGVGLYYEDFSPVSDVEVIRLMNEINAIEHAV